ncbi:hypothetical protein XELAEV_18038310mg [Xenopus laevis]|uniref:Uncharacterized protein n=1 Tax=Xenopus laevis TaxID=8355 RepID=A0A974C5T4_XENLA|nr:hypothetical protein XELAEV_18038310mg [Xenopus laevis]
MTLPSTCRRAKAVTERRISSIAGGPQACRFLVYCTAEPALSDYKAIEKVKLGKRKGDIDRLLSKKEMKWILLLETVTPRGLNKERDIKSGVD